MPFFQKKPVVIAAVQWAGDNLKEVAAFVSDGSMTYSDVSGLSIHTLEGTHHASAGDWIIRGIKGEFYPCKPDIFAATYDPLVRSAA